MILSNRRSRDEDVHLPPPSEHIPDGDEINPRTRAEELNEKISAATHTKAEIDHYPAGHAFLNEEDLLGTFDAEQAGIAWERTVAFLRVHLG